MGEDKGLEMGYPLVMTSMTMEKLLFIVELSIEDGDCPISYVKLPEGTSHEN